MLKQFLFATGIALFSANAGAQLNLPALPQSLKNGNELIDPGNGFAIRIDQPGVKWQIGTDGPKLTVYVGTGAEKASNYLIMILKDHQDELTQLSVSEHVRGMKDGMTKNGGTVIGTSFLPSSIPRDKSYRVIVKLKDVNGEDATGVFYITSPDKFYSIQCIGAVVDETACQAFAASFRLLN